MAEAAVPSSLPSGDLPVAAGAAAVPSAQVKVALGLGCGPEVSKPDIDDSGEAHLDPPELDAAASAEATENH